MVIFGAGASYDSIPGASPSLDYSSSLQQETRMPLTTELFQGRREFNNALAMFPRCRPIFPLLRNSNNGKSIEQILQTLQDDSDEYPERHRQLAAIRFYLQSIIWKCEQDWLRIYSDGMTNYTTLLDLIERWRKPGEQVCLVTFNYDTLLENSLREMGIPIAEIADYVGNDNYKLIKLHGSVNWAREIVNVLPNLAQNDNIWAITKSIIDHADILQISQRYHIISAMPTPKINSDVGLFPAIAIPVETKSEFVCPDEHIDTLRALIPEIDRLLVVGWRGAEQHFLRLLVQNLNHEVRGLVVAGSVQAAEETIENIKRLNIRGEFQCARGGFTEFVVNREGDDFLAGH